ncbi:MAG TPA: class I SAM-dependent methyltransferase [Vicinamibacterales bacterium]|nr:class I SAM-dependent methyltransferase [Vicinamibacterales bacterium]
MDDLIDATARAEREHFWFRGFRRFVRPLVAQAAADRRGVRILDCGCGTGANLAMLASAGTAWGFDLNALGVSLARGAGHTRVARASISHIPFPDATFDLATSFDVWQTLPAAVEAAAPREMFRVLRPGGAMVVNVSALPVLFGNHSVLSEEKQRYTRPRLRELVEAAGFRVERLTYTNFTLFPLVLAVRATQRAMGLKPAAEARGEITIPRRWINEPLAGLLALEARVLRRVDMPVGSSLLCLARKPR